LMIQEIKMGRGDNFRITDALHRYIFMQQSLNFTGLESIADICINEFLFI
jgi:hypothetical protein